MKNVRLKLAQWLVGPDYRLIHKSVNKFMYDVRKDGVVEANQQPRWSPKQEGGVVIAEPKLVNIERSQRGDAAVDRDLAEL